MMIFWLTIFLGILLAVLAVGAWMMFQRKSLSPPAVTELAVQKIFSPEGNLQAEIRNRTDGTFQVEVRRRGQDDSPDTGPTETWTLVYGPAITDSLGEAVEIANQRVGAKQESYP